MPRGLILYQLAELLVLPLLVFVGAREVVRQHGRMTRWRPAWAVAVEPPGRPAEPGMPVACRYEVNGRRYAHVPRRGDRYDRARARRTPDPPALLVRG